MRVVKFVRLMENNGVMFNVLRVVKVVILMENNRVMFRELKIMKFILVHTFMFSCFLIAQTSGCRLFDLEARTVSCGSA